MTAPADVPLLDVPVTDRDWQARAWSMLREWRSTHMGWSLDDALAHRILGPIVRAMAHQLRHQAARDALSREREAVHGRKVEFNGYGMVPARRGPR